MRTLVSLVALSSAARNVADAPISGDTPAVNVAPLGTEAAEHAATSNVVAVKPRKPARKLSGKAVAKPGKPAAKPATDKPAKPAPDAAPNMHGLSTTYRGASPVFRGHGRKLSPVLLNRVAGSFTDRDLAFLRAAYAKFGNKPFQRLDTDAGILSRAHAAGHIRHVSGETDQRDCTFALTAAAIKRVQPVAAAPAKPKR